MSKLKIRDYVAISLMFLVSGSVWGSILNGSRFIVIFFLFSIFYAYKNGVSFKEKEVFYLSVYALCLLINCAFIGDSSSFNLVFGYLLLAMGALCILQSIEFDKFRYLYLNIAAFIALTSVVLYFFQQQNLIPLQLVSSPDRKTRYLMFLFNNFGWGHPFNRLAGPYWEPGAFQIVLNYALILYYNEISHLKFTVAKGKIKLAIIVIAILLTESTAGYINLLVISVMTIINMKVTKKSFIKYICISIGLVIASFFLLASDTYVDKFSQKGQKNSSYEIRRMDNLAMLQMTFEEPFCGYGLQSSQFRSRGKSLGNSTSSNGLLYISSQMGLLFLLFMILAEYNRLKEFYPQRTFLILILLLLFQATEVFIFFPISFIFFFAKSPQKELDAK